MDDSASVCNMQQEAPSKSMQPQGRGRDGPIQTNPSKENDLDWAVIATALGRTANDPPRASLSGSSGGVDQTNTESETSAFLNGLENEPSYIGALANQNTSNKASNTIHPGGATAFHPERLAMLAAQQGAMYDIPVTEIPACGKGANAEPVRRRAGISARGNNANAMPVRRNEEISAFGEEANATPLRRSERLRAATTEPVRTTPATMETPSINTARTLVFRSKNPNVNELGTISASSSQAVTSPTPHSAASSISGGNAVLRVQLVYLNFDESLNEKLKSVVHYMTTSVSIPSHLVQPRVQRDIMCNWFHNAVWVRYILHARDSVAPNANVIVSSKDGTFTIGVLPIGQRNGMQGMSMKTTNKRLQTWIQNQMISTRSYKPNHANILI